jgi:sulfatase maturation enzyme AslB (radical SAM superfamily)
MRLIGMLPVRRDWCRKCRYAVSCAGGCFATNFIETGDMFKPSRNYECALQSLVAEVAQHLDHYSR